MVVAPGESVVFLAPWPVTVLAGSVDAVHGGGGELVDLLARLGLRTLGAFAALPEAVVLGRFGPPGADAHRLARGEMEHDPVATVPPEELAETIELDPPALHVDEAAFAAKMLADRLLAHLDVLGLSCCTASWWKRRPSTASGSPGAGVTRARSPPRASWRGCGGSSTRGC